MNRLNLNWKLNLKSERVEFVKTYLDSISFVPTEEELEVISNYILWGKNTESEKDGPARLKADGVFLESNWSTTPVESLDELTESPTFNENDLKPLDSPAPKKVREVFSREEARKHASPEILEALESLWAQIDSTELIISFYDILHNRRKTPIRETLLSKFSESDRLSLRARAEKLNQFAYFKLKHQLKELRQQQFNYQDSYQNTILPSKIHTYQESRGSSEFGADIAILPMGLNYARAPYSQIFNASHFPEPTLSTYELSFLSTLLWTPQQSKRTFDFSDTSHLYELFNMWDELSDKAEESESIQLFLDTAQVYIGLADLDKKEKLILDMKIRGKSNQDIREAINVQYGHKYQLNYISTLYCKKVLEKIAAAAKEHRKVCENLFFPENFKKCKDCGRILLLEEKNWMKRKRSNDGFSPRCKRCDKLKRTSNATGLDGAKA